MAVVIRFSRHGSKGNPFYRIVAADKKYSRNGRFLEILGTYNPKNKATKFKEERIKYWIGKGAKPSETVNNLIKRSNIGLN